MVEVEGQVFIRKITVPVVLENGIVNTVSMGYQNHTLVRTQVPGRTEPAAHFRLLPVVSTEQLLEIDADSHG